MTWKEEINDKAFWADIPITSEPVVYLSDVSKIYDDFESREKKLTSRLDNAKKRYESKCQELDDCSAFSTKQALEINDFKSRTCENCKLLTGKFIPNTLTCRAGFNPECGGCNKWESK